MMSDNDLKAWIARELAWHRQMLEAHETVAASDHWQKPTGEIMARARRALIRELQIASNILAERMTG